MTKQAKVTIALAIIGTFSGWGTAIITNWDKLSRKDVTPDTPGPTPALRKANVVFVDTALPEKAYNSSLRARGISNANFLEQQILGNAALTRLMTPIVRITRATHPPAQEIAAQHPDLIVIHRSAFDTQEGADVGEQELQSFLAELKGTQAVFLIYSRKPDTDSRYAAELETLSGLQGRVFAYQFRPGDPFSDPAAVQHFIAAIRLLVEASLFENQNVG